MALVWHSHTPRWFFTEDHTNEGELVGERGYVKENGCLYSVSIGIF